MRESAPTFATSSLEVLDFVMSGIVYGVEDRPPLREALPLGVQHLLAMLLGNVTPPLVIALALGLGTAETTLLVLVQAAMVMSGLATLVQASAETSTSPSAT
jgi:xanthine/uracil permease